MPPHYFRPSIQPRTQSGLLRITICSIIYLAVEPIDRSVRIQCSGPERRRKRDGDSERNDQGIVGSDGEVQ